MSLTYGGTTYRSLEEQVRKNMEDISTEAASLSALTDKVDNLKTGGEKVSLTFPASASSGTVTDEQLDTLQANDANYIEMVNDKELYYLNDPGHEEGFLTYSHVGIENSKATIKTLTITVSAKSFVIVTTVVPTNSGGELYFHKVVFEETPSSGAPVQYGGAHIEFMFLSTSSAEFTMDNFFHNDYPDVKSPYFDIICYTGTDGILSYGYNWTIFNADEQAYAIFFYLIGSEKLQANGTPTQVSLGGTRELTDTVTEL